MEDFGYIKNKEKDSHILKKAFLFGAAVFSVVCFVYITVSAYYFVYHDPKNTEIKLIKSPEHEIKVIADDENKDTKPRRAIYEDVFGDDNFNTVQNPNFPKEPILPSKEERQNAVLDNNASIKSEKIAKITEEKPKELVKEISNQDNRIVQKTILENKSVGKMLRVQIGAFASNQTANNYFEKLKANYQNLFSTRRNYIKEVQISGKGTFYRLQIGDFSDQIAAEKFCKQFLYETKKSKSDCILVE